mmetsp:Transcript_37423/g.120525  ORF Transcript_37423/g.120525 Transcript_37423/m.120525 type:complete len:209 (-) Transcript_37423:2728-3354(-)
MRTRARRPPAQRRCRRCPDHLAGTPRQTRAPSRWNPQQPSPQDALISTHRPSSSKATRLAEPRPRPPHGPPRIRRRREAAPPIGSPLGRRHCSARARGAPPWNEKHPLQRRFHPRARFWTAPGAVPPDEGSPREASRRPSSPGCTCSARSAHARSKTPCDPSDKPSRTSADPARSSEHPCNACMPKSWQRRRGQSSFRYPPPRSQCRP